MKSCVMLRGNVPSSSSSEISMFFALYLNANSAQILPFSLLETQPACMELMLPALGQA